MSEINSLEKLLDFLPTFDCENLSELAPKLNLDADEFASFEHWSDKQYTRNCIARTDNYEVLLLCWKDGHNTPIHSHGGKNGLVYLLSGELTEKRYRPGSEILEVKTVKATKGMYSYMEDHMGYHALANESGKDAMTLHIYMKPIYECKVYNDSEKEFKVKTMSDFSYQGELLGNSAGI